MAKILVIEHNATVARFLAQSLRKGGHELTVADNCLEAWRLAAAGGFDVMMLDLVMPGIDGFVLAQNAVEAHPDMNVIFLTGFAGVTLDTYSWMLSGGAPRMSAPFHLREINARVGFLMGYGALPEHAYETTPGARIIDALENGETTANVVYADFRRNREDSPRQAQT